MLHFKSVTLSNISPTCVISNYNNNDGLLINDNYYKITCNVYYINCLLLEIFDHFVFVAFH